MLADAAGRGTPVPVTDGVIKPTDETPVHKIKLMQGDVVEMPVFTFLAACGLEDYKALSFDPEGSFFLGTSVKPHPAKDGLLLHDNMLAMRFQLLMAMTRGAFYHDKELWAKKGSSPRTKDNKVVAMGMYYAGNPSPIKHGEGDESGYRVRNLRWSQKKKLPRYLPDRKGFNKLKSTTPLTMGWVCTPWTLFLSQYMTDNYEDYRGGGSVRKIMGFTYDKKAKARPTPIEKAKYVDAYMTVKEAEDTPPYPRHAMMTVPADGETLQTTWGELAPDASVIIINTPSHEYAVAKLFPFSHVEERDEAGNATSVPIAGYLAAWDPLNGTDLCESVAEKKGQFFQFESTGGLGRCPDLSTMSLTPHQVYSLTGNKVEVVVDGKNVIVDGRDSKPVKGLFVLKEAETVEENGEVVKDCLANLYADPKTWEPIILWTHRQTAAAGAVNKFMAGTGYRKLYAERSVPFATIEEARDGFASHAEVGEQIDNWLKHIDKVTSASGINEAKAEVKRLEKAHADATSDEDKKARAKELKAAQSELKAREADGSYHKMRDRLKPIPPKP